MEAGEGPFETVDTLLLWVVYFGVPASFIAVRHVLIKCMYLSLCRGWVFLANFVVPRGGPALCGRI